MCNCQYRNASAGCVCNQPVNPYPILEVVDWSKPIKYRDDRIGALRFISFMDADKVVVAHKVGIVENVTTRYRNGKPTSAKLGRDWDVINVPEKPREVWIVSDASDGGNMYIASANPPVLFSGRKVTLYREVK